MAVDLKVLADDLERIGKEMLEAASILREGDAAKPEQAEQKEPIPLEKVLADKSRLGHTAEIKVLLQKRGAVKLSEVDPAEYAALLAEAEALK